MHNPTMEPSMTNRATVTFHTSPETKARLEALAKVTRRSSSFLSNEAVERYLAAEEDFVASVLDGVADADADRMQSGTEAKARLHRYIDTAAGNDTNA